MHEVKIYDGEGQLKRIVSPKEICDKISKSFELPSWKKKRLEKQWKPMPIKCKGCDLIFTPSRANNIFHSDACTQRFYNNAKKKEEIK